MRRAVDVVQHQNRDRDRAEYRDDRNEDHPEVMQYRRIHLPGCRMLRKADPSKDQSGKEGADSGDAFDIRPLAANNSPSERCPVVTAASSTTSAIIEPYDDESAEPQDCGDK